MEEREEIITLIDEEGEQFDFLLLDYFQVDNLHYAVLLPWNNEDEDFEASGDLEEMEQEEEAESPIIFRVVKGNNGETALHTIDDEDEWDKVAEIAYERLLSADDGL